MKWLKRIVIALLIILVLVSVGSYMWLKSSAPEYAGNMQLPGLTDKVEARFDEYGVPHIQAQNKHDLYLTFGYLHAQDRLFQMEMMRRAGSGTLAEIIGQKMIKVDRMFRTMGLPEYAIKSEQQLREHASPELINDLEAYLKGVNYFLNNGPTPPEFSIIGIPKKEFTIVDMFYITGAMSFSFSQAQKTEPVIDFVAKQWGQNYLEDLALYHDPNESFMRSFDSVAIPLTPTVTANANKSNESLVAMTEFMAAIEHELPFAPLEGSNSWVVSGKKTKSGKVIFCNDTHIGYMLPQTWYEAHLNCPGFELYGHFLGGVPFALVGRNQHLSWGVTMLENDDMDFFAETIKDNKILHKGEWKTLRTRQEIIHVKGQGDTTLIISEGPHGPIINGAFDGMSGSAPISIWWTYTQKDNYTVDAFYGMNNAVTMEQFESQLAQVHSPGLNLNYGDEEGNIAWWATGQLVKRPRHVNSWTILDGASGNDDPLGYYSFEENPRCINPLWGYVYSANDWPQQFDSIWYPGYYKPQCRADRIRQLIESRSDWDAENIQSVMIDIVNSSDSNNMQAFLAELKESNVFEEAKNTYKWEEVMNWDGTYDPKSAGPTIYNFMLYHVMREACADEMGEKRFELFLGTHQIQRAANKLVLNYNSKWWDDVHTPVRETRRDIIERAFLKVNQILSNEYGENPKVWFWEKACQLELKHPLGEVALFRPFFNDGPNGVYGGNETILQAGYKMDSVPPLKVYFGSQMRIIVDFAEVRKGWNIAPSGQSGHLMSEHYDDQVELYRNREFRRQTMDMKELEKMEPFVFTP